MINYDEKECYFPDAFTHNVLPGTKHEVKCLCNVGGRLPN